MKSFLFACILSCLSIASIARDSTGIKFSNESLLLFMKKSNTSNKMIFVDIYTDWCGPCVKMNKNVFTDKHVGDFFNKNFTNFKVNAEKGEGVLLAKKYNVKILPTILFIDLSNNIVYRYEKYMDSQELLQTAHKSLALIKNNISRTDNASKSNSEKFSKDELRKYLLNIAEVDQTSGRYLDSYLQMCSKNELVNYDNLMLSAKTLSSTRSFAFTVLLDNIGLIKDTQIQNELKKRLPNIISNDFETILNGKNIDINFQKLLKTYKTLNNDLGNFSLKNINLDTLNMKSAYFIKTKQIDQLHKLNSYYINHIISNIDMKDLQRQDSTIYSNFKRNVVASDSVRKTDQFISLSKFMMHRASLKVADDINSIVELYCDHIPNKAYLQQALEWTDIAASVCTNSSSIKNKATILCYLDRKYEAQQAIKMALDMARESKVRNIDQYENLLKYINSK